MVVATQRNADRFEQSGRLCVHVTCHVAQDGGHLGMRKNEQPAQPAHQQRARGIATASLRRKEEEGGGRRRKEEEEEEDADEYE